MTAWIEMIGDAEASPDLKGAYDTVRAPAGTVGSFSASW